MTLAGEIDEDLRWLFLHETGFLIKIRVSHQIYQYYGMSSRIRHFLSFSDSSGVVLMIVVISCEQQPQLQPQE